MRNLILYILGFICLTCAYASGSSIKPINLEGKTAYMLDAGAFPHESNALQLKLKLSSQFRQPITISYLTDRKLYVVTIGPIADKQQALSIEQQLQSGTSTPARAIDTSNTEPPKENAVDANQKIWNLSNADIRAVIAEVSRVTGKNFIIDPRVQGKVSIVSTAPMSDKELYQVFLSVLQVSGFAAVPSGAVVKIIPNLDSKTVTDEMLYKRGGSAGDNMLVEVIPVQYVPAEQLIPVLRPLMPQWSSVSAYAPSNMLILSGRASNIRTLASIIRQVDSSTASGIDMVPLKHALAMDVAATLKDLIKTQPGMSGHNQTMMAADDRSNAILLSGSRTDRIRLRVLIEQLDRQSPDGSNSNTQVVYLNYLRAQDLVPILAGIAQANFSGNVGTTIGTITRPELDSTNPASNIANNNSGTISAGASSAGSSSGQSSGANQAATQNTSGATTQNEGSTKPTVQIIAEPNTNSIIINAPPSLIRILRTVINQLDIKPAQLLIEALVAEVDEADVNSLGIEWGSNRQTGDPASFRPGFAILNSATSINDFQAQIYALARVKKANILSTPSVVVLDNRQAKILVGKQVSVASTSYPNNAGGTTTASPFVTFDRVNVALHLYVRPQITRDSGIQLQIDQGNDTLEPVTTETTAAGNPTFKISSIVTSVHVESGDIIVLGGLTQDTLGNDDNRLPILGGLPGIGRLFQHNIRNREKRVLMVFIRPIILKNKKESFQITSSKYNTVRQHELEWLRTQDYHDDNQEVALPPLYNAELPKPFGPPPPAALASSAPPPVIFRDK